MLLQISSKVLDYVNLDRSDHKLVRKFIMRDLLCDANTFIDDYEMR